MKQVVKPLDTRSDFKKAVDMLKTDLPAQIELVTIQANLAKKQYDALLKEGFTEQQAMQIITTQPAWR